MRIDDENKVVWCSESEMEWYVSFNASVGNSTFSDSRRIKKLSTGTESVPSNYCMTTADRVETIRAISSNYTFKLEEQKYYWRKKKEHLAWFEEEKYLNFSDFSMECHLSDRSDLDAVGRKFTSQEARYLLKDDFDKFEKVECE